MENPYLFIFVYTLAAIAAFGIIVVPVYESFMNMLDRRAAARRERIKQEKLDAPQASWESAVQDDTELMVGRRASRYFETELDWPPKGPHD